MRTIDSLLNQLKGLLPQIKTTYHVRSLEVFGSVVRGEASENSDLDLLVTFDKMPSLFKFVALQNELSDRLGVKVDLVMKDSLKPEIGRRILEEAQPI